MRKGAGEGHGRDPVRGGCGGWAPLRCWRPRQRRWRRRVRFPSSLRRGARGDGGRSPCPPAAHPTAPLRRVRAARPPGLRPPPPVRLLLRGVAHPWVRPPATRGCGKIRRPPPARRRPATSDAGRRRDAPRATRRAPAAGAPARGARRARRGAHRDASAGAGARRPAETSPPRGGRCSASEGVRRAARRGEQERVDCVFFCGRHVAKQSGRHDDCWKNIRKATVATKEPLPKKNDDTKPKYFTVSSHLHTRSWKHLDANE